jgi:hypothetical protein
MTKYYSRIALEFYREVQYGRCWYDTSLTLPEGWNITRILATGDGTALVEVDDDKADPSLAGRMVLPWFQTTTDGTVVITNWEVVDEPVPLPEDLPPELRRIV